MRKPNTSDIGTAIELQVAADLLQKGFEVYKALSGGASFDLIATSNGNFYRIEVKARRSNFSSYSQNKADVLAFLSTTGIKYVQLPSQKEWQGQFRGPEVELENS